MSDLGLVEGSRYGDNSVDEFLGEGILVGKGWEMGLWMNLGMS